MQHDMNEENKMLIALIMRGLNFNFMDFDLILTATPEDLERTEVLRANGMALGEALHGLLCELQERKDKQLDALVVWKESGILRCTD